MKKNFFVTCLVLLTCFLFSQYNQKQILLNQIRRHEANREFNKAIELYEELVELFPEDYSFINSYIRLLLITSQPEKAEKLLANYKNLMSEETYLEYKIPILNNSGDREKSLRLVRDYLRKNPGRMNFYRTIISVFERERLPDYAIEIGNLARRNSGDEYLYTLEMARNYQNMNNFDKAMLEYMKHLERNTNFLNFVSNRFKAILTDNPETIKFADKHRLSLIKSNPASKPIINELYALSLLHIERHEEALEIYKTLDISKLINFSNELKAAGNFELAKNALLYYIETVEELHLRAEAQISIARIYINQNNYEKAKDFLKKVYHNDQLKDRNLRFRTRANKNARELLAEIALREKKDMSTVFSYFDEAKLFSNNRNEQNQIEYQIVFYQIMNQDFEEAENRISNILANEPPGSTTFNSSYYYKYLLSLLQNNVNSADSLLNEMIIISPENSETTNSLFLSILISSLDNNSKNVFIEAFRLKNLFQTELAVETILEHLDKQFNEELAIIVADWLVELFRFDEAKELYSHNFNDDTLNGYSVIKLATINAALEKEYSDLITDFLRHNPNHIFSTKLRQMLMNRSK